MSDIDYYEAATPAPTIPPSPARQGAVQVMTTLPTIPVQLRAVAAAMREPERVVLNPIHYFETASGDYPSYDPSEACRACVAGHIELLGFEPSLSPIVGGDEGLANRFTFGYITADQAAAELDALALDYEAQA